MVQGLDNLVQEWAEKVVYYEQTRMIIQTASQIVEMSDGGTIETVGI